MSFADAKQRFSNRVADYVRYRPSYPSALIEGERECRSYMLDMFGDWQAPGISVILHEKKGGYANNVRSLAGLAAKAESEGVRIAPGVRVTGLQTGGGAVTAVETDQGQVRCDQLIIAAGPWIRDLWAMLDLPGQIPVMRPGSPVTEALGSRPMWTYWANRWTTYQVYFDGDRVSRVNR